MSDDEDLPPLKSLQLAHEKLDETLVEQADHSTDIDRKAMGMLRASFTVSSVTAAVLYYIARQRSESLLGSIDNPFTYVAFLFGGLSLFLSFSTVLHTKIETELNAPDIERQVEFGRKEFLVTPVETYPEYIARNDNRLSADINLLTGAQLSLSSSPSLRS